MKSLRRFIAAATATAYIGVVNGFVCDIPTSGCTNGMFNQERCECDCISPFCPDSYGDCTVPTNNCGGNPWADCVRGVDCPWYVNPLKAESCTTGPNLPIAMYKIYNTKTACCNTNFAYSTTCNMQTGTSQPTKHPTIAAPEDDEFEVIPIKFDVRGLPDEIKMRELKDEMTTVLKRILLRLADRIPGLKVSNVEEKVVLTRNLLRALRRLEQNVSLYFNVYVIRDEDKKFAPLIINEIRDSYDEVLEQIQTFADTKYIGSDLDLNWCASQNGKFDLCVQDINTPAISREPTQTQFVAKSDSSGGEGSEGNDGLASWAVALIVIFFLLPLACIIGTILYFSFFNDDETTTEDFLKEEGSLSTSKSQAVVDVGHDRSLQLVLAESQDNALVDHHNNESKYDDDSFTINTRTVNTCNMKKIEAEDAKSVNTRGTKKSVNTKKSSKSNKRISRDPTMYIPGQENRPDPEAKVLMIADRKEASGRHARRVYYADEDPRPKPKRDPTMYVDGKRDATNVHFKPNPVEDPLLRPKRDPTIFVEGQIDPDMYVGGKDDPPRTFSANVRDYPSMTLKGLKTSNYSEGLSVEEMYNDDDHWASKGNGQFRGSMQDLDEDERYDSFGFLATSEDTFGQNEMSFKTQEPDSESVSSNSRKSGKSKSKKSRRSTSSRKISSSKLRKSLQSNWGASAPDMGIGENIRKTKSYYSTA